MAVTILITIADGYVNAPIIMLSIVDLILRGMARGGNTGT